MKYLLPFILLLATGCAATQELLGGKPLDVPPEFNQKVVLITSDKYEQFQAPRSGYDPGDLQAFHSQHVFPMLVEDKFKELFSEVRTIEAGKPSIEMGSPEEAAIFEVEIADLAHDIYNESDHYRSYVMIAAAMKSPRGKIFWQKTVRGEGYAWVDPQHGSRSGPGEAVVDAVNDGLNKLQEELIKSPQVKLQLKYYKQIDQARTATETKV